MEAGYKEEPIIFYPSNIEMVKSRQTRKSTRGGSQTPVQFFAPAVLPPVAGYLASPISAAPTAGAIRPVLQSTFQAKGGSRKTRRATRGGFSPSVMGSFIANAQAAVVPIASFALWHTLVGKKKGKNVPETKSSRKGGKQRK
jgi:hypothetical protein